MRILLSIILFMVISLPAHAAVGAGWGCPKAEGAVAIAEAWHFKEDIGETAEEFRCVVFPGIIPVTPVKFIVDVPEDGQRAYVWEMKLPNGQTFYTNYAKDVHDLLLESLPGI